MKPVGFMGTPDLAVRHLPPHEISDFAGTPGLAHLGTNSLSVNRRIRACPRVAARALICPT